jgi:hypothetical protein
MVRFRLFGPAGVSLFLLALVLTGAACRTDSRISEEGALKVLRALDDATLQKDTEAIAALLTEDFFAEVVRPGATLPQVKTLDRNTYLRYLDSRFRFAELLDLGRSKPAIDLEPDGNSARVTSTLKTSWSNNGRLEKHRTQETMVLELRAGQLLIKSVRSVNL